MYRKKTGYEKKFIIIDKAVDLDYSRISSVCAGKLHSLIFSLNAFEILNSSKLRPEI